MLALPDTQGARPTSPRMRDCAADHLWMGRKLALWPDDELAAILETLELVAYGEVRTARLPRPDLIERIRKLDLALNAVRADAE